MASESRNSQAGDGNPAATPGLDEGTPYSILNEVSKLSTSEEA